MIFMSGRKISHRIRNKEKRKKGKFRQNNTLPNAFWHSILNAAFIFLSADSGSVHITTKKSRLNKIKILVGRNRRTDV